MGRGLLRIGGGVTGLDAPSSTALAPSGSGALVIENQDLNIASGNAIDLDGWTGSVIIRNCRIRFNYDPTSTGRAIERSSSGLTSLTIQDVEILHMGAPRIGAGNNVSQIGIYIASTPNVTIARVTTKDCSTGALLVSCTGGSVTYFENHRSRGPFPRGMAVQFNGCSGFTISNCSDEPLPGISWTEDSFSNYASSDMAWSNLFIPIQSDGVTGRGIVVEQLTSFDVTVDNCEFLHTYNGAYGGFEVEDPVAFTNMKTRAYNMFSTRGYGGSTSSGASLPALVATHYNPTPGVYTSISGVWAKHPAKTPNGTTLSSGLWNHWFNPTTTGGIAQGTGTLTQDENWVQTLAPIRNQFSWRNRRRLPEVVIPPRVGSYWIVNPNTGANGLIANQLVVGAQVSVMPGQYTFDPNVRSWAWYLDGVSQSTDFTWVLPAGSDGKTLTLGEVVANDAGALSETFSAGHIIAA